MSIWSALMVFDDDHLAPLSSFRSDPPLKKVMTTAAALVPETEVQCCLCHQRHVEIKIIPQSHPSSSSIF